MCTSHLYTQPSNVVILNLIVPAMSPAEFYNQSYEFLVSVHNVLVKEGFPWPTLKIEVFAVFEKDQDLE